MGFIMEFMKVEIRVICGRNETMLKFQTCPNLIKGCISVPHPSGHDSYSAVFLATLKKKLLIAIGCK